MTERLKSGVETFRSHAFPPRQDLFADLANGQSPHTLFITCSDSRIDPSLITQTEPGELFVIRNAGNLVPHAEDSGEVATIEYAVVALGVQDIVVCGHSQCGAMGALVAPEPPEGLPRVVAWLDNARSTLERVRSAEPGSPDADAVLANVSEQLERLRALPFVREREASGALRLHGWVYVFERGEVLVRQADGRFGPLLEPAEVGS